MSDNTPSDNTPNLHVLITGASSGIGRATAIRLSSDRRLILHGRDLDRLEETRRACQIPERHLIWPFDLKNVEGISGSLPEFLSEHAAAVEAFVHCAGIAVVLPMRSVDYRSARETMDVNFSSAAEIVSLLLKKKVNDKRLSNIIFVSSIFSRFGARAHAHYCASKAALDGLMRALAVELAPAVRVNSILPGAIDTPLAAAAFSDAEIMEKFQRDYPLGVGQPSDIAEAIRFLLSQEARWWTGQEIVVDGGRTVNLSQK